MKVQTGTLVGETKAASFHPQLASLTGVFFPVCTLASSHVRARTPPPPVRPVWRSTPTSTLVLWVGSQRVPEVACFAPVTVDTRCVVDALETPAGQAVAVPGGPGVHIVVALTGLTRPHRATLPKGVPKVAVGTELTAGAWKEQMPKPEWSPTGSKSWHGDTGHPLVTRGSRTTASGAGAQGKG